MGVHVLSVNLQSGVVEKIGSRRLNHAVYLAYAPDGRYVYSCSDTGLASFAVEGSSLSMVDEVPLPGGPCHISAMPDGRRLAWAEYMGGTCGSVEVADGRFAKVVVHRHSGSGPNLPRQAGPHCHQAVPTPDGKGYCVVDLGLDQIVEYRKNDKTGQTCFIIFDTIPKGAGPRHLLFHPNGRLAFLVYELGNLVSSLSWSPDDGFKLLDTLPTLADSHNFIIPYFHPPSPRLRRAGISTIPHSSCLAAAIRFTPDGKCIVVSNRGENSLVVFDFDEATGKLTFKARTLLSGDWPRDFAFAGDDIVLVAFERSGEVQTLRYDSESGMFAPLVTLGGFYRPLAVLPQKEVTP